MFRMGETPAHAGIPKPDPPKKDGKLVIVESPAKARTVGRFLGNPYRVRASIGHVRDLLRSRLSVDVENRGSRAGKEIVQVYLRDVRSRLMRPEKELKAFAKVALEPGETRTITFTLDEQALSYYDPALKRWVAEAGEFQVLVGSSSRDIRLAASFNFKGESS